MKQIATNYTANCVGSFREARGIKLIVHSPAKFVFRQAFTLAFAFVLFLPFAYAQKGTITGTVRGIEGALQSATVAAGKTTVLTDNNGRFSMLLNPGSYTLIITHTGYRAVMQDLIVEDGSTKTIDVSMIAGGDLGEVVVLGSRSLVQRSNLNTAVPVDVFSSKQLEQTGQVSLTQMLNYSAPSFNASRPHNNEPATLRGLNPDQVLILVNGTRRHSMGIVTASGARGQLGGGSAPNDLNSIPFTAIEKIEILRDGAAAQYGSDAIAGVINIQLKKSTGKTLVQMQTGQFYKGDGGNIVTGINHGFSLNNKGFLNFSTDLRFNDFTYRGGTFTGTVYKTIPATATPASAQALRAQDDSLISINNFDRNKVSNAGSPKVTRVGALLNGGYAIGKKWEVFWTAAFNSRPSSALQAYTFPKNANRINPLLFPNGFKSKNDHTAADISGIAGAKGVTINGWRWELTTAYGNSTDKYRGENTNNATQFYTLGKDAPTSFYGGTLIYSQLTNNLQFSKSLSSSREKLSNISIGAEWRLEYYRIKAGEESGWKDYDLLGRKLAGIGGFTPDNEVVKGRNVAAAYVDFETEVARRLLVDLAARYEDYSDFGGNLAGKIAARYKLSERLYIRGSVNNGFRAPSLPQRYYSVLQRTLTVRGGVITPTTTGWFRNDDPVVQAFGVPNLTAERSVNASGGLTAALGNTIRMTVDAYWIQIRNRIVLSGRFDTTNKQVKEILHPFPDVTQAQFFVNAINTRTKGVDIVLNGNWRIKNGTLSAMLGANFTQTRLFGNIKAAGKLAADSVNNNILFNREERARLEIGQPDSKIVLSLNYKTKKFGALVRNTRFGETGTRSINPALNPDENFSSKILTDLGLSFTPKTWLTVTAGANNIFDVYPDRIQDIRNTAEGLNIYSLEATPFGFYGGYYFVGISLSF
jgi:iron complex outermembrane receptor protein